MTCDELKAAINSKIAQNARIAAIRSRMDAGTADFLDSELYTAITAEITAEQMRRNVLALSDREPAFVGVVRERYTDTFSVFNAVQRILDAVTGIRIRTVQPEFENDRAHKIGHSLNDPTVPESVIERRAYSATENFVRSQHDRCTKANASFRSRAGLDCRITRTGGAKCCDWCASVSGSFTTGNAPDGIWGRHDNCKCSITYETRRGSFQQLSGSGRGWDTVEELPDLPLHVLASDEIKKIEKQMSLNHLTGGVRHGILNEEEQKFLDRILADSDMPPRYRQILMDRFCSGSEIAQKAFSKFIPAASVTDSNYTHGSARYYPYTRSINMNYLEDSTYDLPGEIWFHEHGHMIDHLAGYLSGRKGFESAIKKDFVRWVEASYGLKTDLSIYGKTAMKMFERNPEYADAQRYAQILEQLRSNPQICREIGKEMKMSAAVQAAVSDIINGVSQGMIKGCGFHDDDYWDGDALVSEAFAHMFEAQFDKARFDTMKTYFPRAFSQFNQMLMEVVT